VVWIQTVDWSGGSSEGRGGQGNYFGRDSLVAPMTQGSNNTASAAECISLIDTALCMWDLARGAQEK
jgi:hypothetical protein